MSTGDRQPCPECGALNYAADDICLSCGYDLPPGGPQSDLPPPGKAEPAPPPPEEGQEPQLDAAKVVQSALWPGGVDTRSWGRNAAGCGILALLALAADLAGMLLFGYEPALFRFHALFTWIDITAWLTGIGGAVGAVVGWGVSGPIAKVLGRWDRRVVRGSAAFIGLAIGAVGTSWSLESISPF